MAQQQQSGQLIQADFNTNIGGLNTSDSPFMVRPDQAQRGKNYDYIRTGAIRKRFGHEKINETPNDMLKTSGIGLLNGSDGTKEILRAAGKVIQTFDGINFNTLSLDNSAGTTDILDESYLQGVKFVSFNTVNYNATWFSGAANYPHAVIDGDNITKNGTNAPEGEISLSKASGSGEFLSTGNYVYAVSFRKRSTQSESNVVLDETIEIASATEEVTIDLTGLTNVDTDLYDQINIYRSATNGVEGFTAGDLIAELAITADDFTDTGNAILNNVNIARSGNLVLDNSVLPEGDYNVIASFKRRLVTAKNSTIYLSDLNKPESWPIVNTITIPSGGKITGLSIISFNTPTAASTDEFLVIFKERETWVVTGDDLDNWSLQYLDDIGCISDRLVASGNGYISWLDYRGIYLWQGSGKPVYISRPIENLFARDGNLNSGMLSRGWATFYRKENLIIWFLSESISGEQKYAIKLDLKLTIPQMKGGLGDNIMDAVFITDASSIALFAGQSMVPPAESEEFIYAGDDQGFIYRLYNLHSDGGSAIDFEYETPFLDMGSPNIDKRYHKVIVWVEDFGDWDLQLDYWAAYRQGEALKTSQVQRIADTAQSNIPLWDVAFWDVAFWDDYEGNKLKPLVFHLRSSQNNTEGEAIKLKFVQSGSDQPLTIFGFTIFYTAIGSRRG